MKHKDEQFIEKNIMMWQMSRKKSYYGFNGYSFFFLNKKFDT